VQVGAFADPARAAALAGQLETRGLTAFQKATIMRSGATLHVVLAGPFASRTAASAGLESAAQIPGVGQPILQAVPPAAAVR
jgi:cell division septation protein DedD